MLEAMILAAMVLGFIGGRTSAPLSTQPVPLVLDIDEGSIIPLAGHYTEGYFTKATSQLLHTDVNTPVTFMINSPGGIYDGAAAAFLLLMDRRRDQGQVTRCVVVGMAASLAAVVLSHCAERYAVPTAVVMVHAARAGGLRPLNQYESDRLRAQLTGLDEMIWAPMRALFDNSTYWNDNFKAERRIPVLELEKQAPNVLHIIDGIRGRVRVY